MLFPLEIADQIRSIDMWRGYEEQTAMLLFASSFSCMHDEHDIS